MKKTDCLIIWKLAQKYKDSKPGEAQVLWMAYEDIPRVAQLKVRPDREDQIRPGGSALRQIAARSRAERFNGHVGPQPIGLFKASLLYCFELLRDQAGPVIWMAGVTFEIRKGSCRLFHWVRII